MLQDDLSHYISDDLEESVYGILEHFGLYICSHHTKRVISYIDGLALQYGVDRKKAKTAALLHDIGGIIPTSERIAYCIKHQIPYCEAEKEVPLLLHQKLSKHLSRTQFNVMDEEILSAIACHTTLKADADVLDKLLFLSDKMEWDQQGEPPYRKELEKIVVDSLDKAVYQYMKYNLDHALLKVIHPDYQAGIDALAVQLQLISS